MSCNGNHKMIKIETQISKMQEDVDSATIYYDSAISQLKDNRVDQARMKIYEGKIASFHSETGKILDSITTKFKEKTIDSATYLHVINSINVDNIILKEREFKKLGGAINMR